MTSLKESTCTVHRSRKSNREAFRMHFKNRESSVEVVNMILDATRALRRPQNAEKRS
jgi:hypothetical protein